MKIDVRKAEAIILKRMSRQKIWGGKHQKKDFFVKEGPEFSRGMENLIKSNLIIQTRNNNCLHVRLNHERLQEIRKIVEILE